MTYNPKISIAMTSYNMAKFIKKAIKSIVKQTYKNWELIIVDDASTDDTLGVIDSCIKTYSFLKGRTKIVKRTHNAGYGRSLKTAIEKGSGELVAVIDSDDYLATNEAFGVMVKAHEDNPKASLCYSTYYKCEKQIKRGIPRKIKPIPKGKTYLSSMKNYKVSHLKVFKRAAYDKTKGIDDKLVKSVDKDLVLKLEEVGGLVFVNQGLYVHRKHYNCLTNKFGRMSEAERINIYKARDGIIRNAKKRRGLV